MKQWILHSETIFSHFNGQTVVTIKAIISQHDVQLEQLISKSEDIAKRKRKKGEQCLWNMNIGLFIEKNTLKTSL